MRYIFFDLVKRVYHKQEVCFLLCFLGQIVSGNVILIQWIKIDHILL